MKFIKNYGEAPNKQNGVDGFFQDCRKYIKNPRYVVDLPSWQMLDVRKGFLTGLFTKDTKVICVENNQQLKSENKLFSHATELIEAQRLATPQPYRDNIIIKQQDLETLYLDGTCPIDIGILDLCGYLSPKLVNWLEYVYFPNMAIGGSVTITLCLNLRQNLEKNDYYSTQLCNGILYEVKAKSKKLSLAWAAKAFDIKGAWNRFTDSENFNSLNKTAFVYATVFYSLLAKHWESDCLKSHIYRDSRMTMITLAAHNVQKRKDVDLKAQHIRNLINKLSLDKNQ